MSDVEAMIKAALERRGMTLDENGEEVPANGGDARPQVEALLSDALGGSVPALNADKALARLAGADTLNGETL